MNVLPDNFVATINSSMADTLTSLSGYIVIILGVVALATIIHVILDAIKKH